VGSEPARKSRSLPDGNRGPPRPSRGRHNKVAGDESRGDFGAAVGFTRKSRGRSGKYGAFPTLRDFNRDLNAFLVFQMIFII
jgi:hypothetical protein